MPAYAAQRRGSQSRGRRRQESASHEAELTAPPPELTVQQQLGLVQGVALSPRDGQDSPTLFDAARAAMCLLKEEDHVWTIETCMETINLLRARNNTLKEQLLEVDTNFSDHIQARQRRVRELELATESLAAEKYQVEATLESERGDRRRQERDHERRREAETLAYESKIKVLVTEVESLQGYSGERERVNAQIASLEAANAELRDQQESNLQALRKKLAEVEGARDDDIRRLLIAAREKMREEVEIEFGGAHESLLKENAELKAILKQRDSKLKDVLSDLVKERAGAAELRTELDIVRALESKSAGKIKYYMRMLKRNSGFAFGSEDGNESFGSPRTDGPREKREVRERRAERPGTAPAKLPYGRREGANACNRRGSQFFALNVISANSRKGGINSKRGPTVRSRSAGASYQSPSPHRPPSTPRGVSKENSTEVTHEERQEAERTRPKSAILGTVGSRSRQESGVVDNAAALTPGTTREVVEVATITTSEQGRMDGGESPREDAGEKEKSSDERAVQVCWRDLDARRHDCAGTNCATRPARPATCGGIRQRNSQRASEAGRTAHRYGLKLSNFQWEAPADDRCRNSHHAIYTSGRPREASTARARLSCGGPNYGCSLDTGSGGDVQRQHRWETFESKLSSSRRKEVEVRGGKLWSKQESRERELFETLRVATGESSMGVEEGFQDESYRQLAGAPGVADLSGEDRLLQAVDTGNPEVLSPGRGTSVSRAAKTRAVLDTGICRLVKPPQQTVLVRERLGGVGMGAPTAPRRSELDEVAAAKAAMIALDARRAHHAESVAADSHAQRSKRRRS